MANLSGFDANKVEPNGEFTPLPDGQYLAAIIESDWTPTKKKDGSYLKLMFQVTDGPFKGRKLWARLNLQNPSETAVHIAEAELSSICRAVGVLAPKDSSELHNILLVIHVKVCRRTDNNELTNEIAGYAKKESPAPPNGAPTKASNSPPWKRS